MCQTPISWQSSAKATHLGFSALLSRLWAEPSVLGEATVTVVGVTPDTFPGIQIGVRTDIVVPAPVVGRIIGLQPNSVPLRYAFGRLAQGQSVE